MKKRNKMMVCAAIFTMLSGVMTSFAGEWKTDTKGYWYEKDDGGYAVSEWIADAGKWYYIGDDGYMLSNTWIGNYYVGADGAMLVNTITPDGYYVGSDGAWVEGGVSEVPELTVTPYRDIPWEISWIEFSRDTMIDHGNYYELPNQKLYPELFTVL